MQVGEEAVDFGVADVGAVEEGDEVEEGEPGDEVEVEFTEECFVLVGAMRVSVIILLIDVGLVGV